MSFKILKNPNKEEEDFLKSLPKKKPRLLLDENLAPEFKDVFCKLKFNVKTINDFGLEGREDEEIFHYAYKQKRILISYDKRFFSDDKNFPLKLAYPVIILQGGKDGVAIALIRDFIAPYLATYKQHKIIIDSSNYRFKIKSRDFSTGKINYSLYEAPPGKDARIRIE